MQRGWVIPQQRLMPGTQTHPLQVEHVIRPAAEDDAREAVIQAAKRWRYADDSEQGIETARGLLHALKALDALEEAE